MATIQNRKLIIDNKEYKIRYILTTRCVVVCETDELEGVFKDEYPLAKVTNHKCNK